MLLSLNKNLKNILLYTLSIVAIFLLFKFIIFIIPIAALGWLTYKLVGISKEKLSAMRINKITRANRKHIDKAFMHSANYGQIFKPTEFDKHSSVIDVEYEEIKR